MEVGPLRLPMTPMEEANKARLIQAMKDFGVKVQ
jgi:dihydrodipicolinate synthase/N-acetylneuraminate lyase